MKNNLFLILLFFFLENISLAEDFNIEAKNIKIDKKNQISIFENDVVIKDKQNIIKSDFAKYDKQKNFIIVRKNIVLEDKIGNKFYGEYATFDKDKKIFITVGKSNIINHLKPLRSPYGQPCIHPSTSPPCPILLEPK